MMIYDKRSGQVVESIGRPVSGQAIPPGDFVNQIYVETTYGFELRLTTSEAQELINLLKSAFEELETQAEGQGAK